jgi:chemotaxis protein MotA
MRASTIIGLIAAFIIVFLSIFLRGGMPMVMLFVDIPSMILTGGCTVACMFINFTPRQLWDGLLSFRYCLVSKMATPADVIEVLVEMAVKARKEGFMALRELSTKGRYPLLDIGVDLVADGTDPEVTRGILETVSDYINVKISGEERFWRDMSIYAPFFGMLGTLVGLIMLLKTLKDPETIAPNMSLALVTTFYGCVIAGIICMPVAGKIHVYNTNLALSREIIIEGIASIQAGDNSQIVREKLQAYLAGLQ